MVALSQPYMPVRLDTTQSSGPRGPRLLCEYVFNKFGTVHDPESVSCLRKIPVISIVAGSIICGYVSWYPLILGVMKIGIQSKAIKVILAGCSWISYGSLYAWGTGKIARGLFEKYSANEEVLLRDPKHPFLGTAYKVAIAFLGLGAALPNAYFTYVFNNDSLGWALVNIAGSIGLAAYSIHNMFVELAIPRWQWLKKICPTSFSEKAKWNEVREFLVTKLERFAEEVPEMGRGALQQVFRRADHGEYAVGLFSKIFLKCRGLKQDPGETTIGLKKVKYPVKFISALLPISNIYSNAKAVLNLVNKVTDLTAVKVLSVAAALSPSYLSYSLNRDCVFSLIKMIANRMQGYRQMTLSGLHHPQKRAVTLFVATALSLLSSSIDYATAKEIFPNDTPEDWTALISSIVNSLAITLLPMIGMSLGLLDYYMSFCGTSEIKFKLDLKQKIERLNFFLRRCSEAELVGFVNLLGEDAILGEELTGHFPWLAIVQQPGDPGEMMPVAL